MSGIPQPVGFGLCGASGIAAAHAHAIQRSRGARLVSVCSRDPDRARSFGEAFGCAWTANYDDVLSNRRVGAVDIVTEPARHTALALQALASGKHVLVEKPIDESLESAARLVAAAAASSAIVSVISPRRFDTALQALRERLDSGDIGPVHMSTATMLMYRDRAYYEQPPGWRQRSGHVLLNQGIHWLDTFIWLFGFPELVTATTSIHRAFAGGFDTATVCSRHRNGVLSVLSASTACEGPRTEHLTVMGNRGSLHYSPDRRNGPLKRVMAVLRRVRNNADDPLAAQVSDFVDSIRSGKPPSVTAQDGYDALRFVKLCEEAAAAGEPRLATAVQG